MRFRKCLKNFAGFLSKIVVCLLCGIILLNNLRSKSTKIENGICPLTLTSLKGLASIKKPPANFMANASRSVNSGLDLSQNYTNIDGRWKPIVFLLFYYYIFFTASFCFFFEHSKTFQERFLSIFCSIDVRLKRSFTLKHTVK